MTDLRAQAAGNGLLSHHQGLAQEETISEPQSVTIEPQVAAIDGMVDRGDSGSRTESSDSPTECAQQSATAEAELALSGDTSPSAWLQDLIMRDPSTGSLDGEDITIGEKPRRESKSLATKEKRSDTTLAGNCQSLLRGGNDLATLLDAIDSKGRALSTSQKLDVVASYLSKVKKILDHQTSKEIPGGTIAARVVAADDQNCPDSNELFKRPSPKPGNVSRVVTLLDGVAMELSHRWKANCCELKEIARLLSQPPGSPGFSAFSSFRFESGESGLQPQSSSVSLSISGRRRNNGRNGNSGTSRVTFERVPNASASKSPIVDSSPHEQSSDGAESRPDDANPCNQMFQETDSASPEGSVGHVPLRQLSETTATPHSTKGGGGTAATPGAVSIATTTSSPFTPLPLMCESPLYHTAGGIDLFERSDYPSNCYYTAIGRATTAQTPGKSSPVRPSSPSGRTRSGAPAASKISSTSKGPTDSMFSVDDTLDGASKVALYRSGSSDTKSYDSTLGPELVLGLSAQPVLRTSRDSISNPASKLVEILQDCNCRERTAQKELALHLELAVAKSVESILDEYQASFPLFLENISRDRRCIERQLESQQRLESVDATPAGSYSSAVTSPSNATLTSETQDSSTQVLSRLSSSTEYLSNKKLSREMEQPPTRVPSIPFDEPKDLISFAATLRSGLNSYLISVFAALGNFIELEDWRRRSLQQALREAAETKVRTHCELLQSVIESFPRMGSCLGKIEYDDENDGIQTATDGAYTALKYRLGSEMGRNFPVATATSEVDESLRSPTGVPQQLASESSVIFAHPSVCGLDPGTSATEARIESTASLAPFPSPPFELEESVDYEHANIAGLPQTTKLIPQTEIDPVSITGSSGDWQFWQAMAADTSCTTPPRNLNLSSTFMDGFLRQIGDDNMDFAMTPCAPLKIRRPPSSRHKLTSSPRLFEQHVALLLKAQRMRLLRPLDKQEKDWVPHNSRGALHARTPRQIPGECSSRLVVFPLEAIVKVLEADAT